MGTNPTFTFKPGSVVDRVLKRQPLAHCKRVAPHGPKQYAVYITRKSHLIIGQGWSAHAAWTDALKTLS